MLLQQWYILHRALKGVPTRSQDDHMRVSRLELLPGQPGCVLPDRAEDVLPSRGGHQFRCPVARRHQRVEPLQDSHAWFGAEGGGLELQICQPLLVPLDQRLCLVTSVQRHAYAHHVGPDVLEPVGTERHNHWVETGKLCNGLCDVSFADRTNLALCLREDHVRAHRLQLVEIESVWAQCLPSWVLWFARMLRESFHLGIDLSTARRDINLYGAHRRQSTYLWGIVAFVRASHHLIETAECSDHLCSAG